MGLSNLPKMGADLCPRKSKEHQRNKGIMKSPRFVKACEAVGIEPTLRQASKWKRNKGKAWTEGRA